MTSSIFLGLLIGTVMGLTGAGGGILSIPALVLGTGMGMVAAKPVALTAVSLGSAIGAADGLRLGLVRYKAALYMVLLGALFSPLGQWAAHQVPAAFLAVLFSAILLLVAWRSWKKPAPEPEHSYERQVPCQLNPATGRFSWTPACFTTLGLIGATTGLMTGMLGVGGGFFIVPMLQRYTNLTQQSIVVTSLAVIALVSGSTVLQMMLHGQAEIVSSGWIFVIATCVGMVLSRLVAARVPALWSKRGFALLVLLATVLLLLKTFAPGLLPLS